MGVQEYIFVAVQVRFIHFHSDFIYFYFVSLQLHFCYHLCYFISPFSDAATLTVIFMSHFSSLILAFHFQTTKSTLLQQMLHL
jgi:hypothetical protein